MSNSTETENVDHQRAAELFENASLLQRDSGHAPSYRGYIPGIVFAVAIALLPIVYLLFGTEAFELHAWSGHRENLAEVFAGIFGLSLTVVAIVVQLAAQRYSPQIVLYFVRDPVNVVFFVFIVFSSTYMILIPGITEDSPAFGLLNAVGVLLAVAAFGVLIPYFVYVFISVQPDTLVRTIAGNTTKTMRRVATRSWKPDRIAEAQYDCLEGLHRLTDIGISAIQHADRDLVMTAVRAIQDVLEQYSTLKASCPTEWFEPPSQLRDQFAGALLKTMHSGQTWLEAAVFFELDHMGRRAAEAMPELVTRISSLARHVNSLALRRHDAPLIMLVDHFFNTQIRHGINAGNVRVLYAVLEHYRRAIELYVEHDEPRAVECAGWLVYYGQLANVRSLGFVTTIIAHDLRRVCLVAYKLGKSILGDSLVDCLLNLDEDEEGDRSEQALLGVRKAQSILATELLHLGLSAPVQRIAEDMIHEPDDRLSAIRAALVSNSSDRFWEMTDRGENFEYLAPELRTHLDKFFEMVHAA